MTTRRQCGFTLIELLVVVSIIALLIALLLPSLGAAKERARAVVCGARLQQLAMGNLMYTNDYKGRFQDHTTIGQPGFDPLVVKDYHWSDWMTPLFRNYLNSSFAAFECPSQQEKRAGWAQPVSPYPTRPYMPGFAITFEILPNHVASGYVYRMEQVSDPSGKFFHGDAGRTRSLGPSGVYYEEWKAKFRHLEDPNYCVPAVRHQMRPNFSFIDGSVRSQAWDESVALYALDAVWLRYYDVDGDGIAP